MKYLLTLFRLIKARLANGSAARDVATLTVGTIIAQGITLAVTPLLTRLYTPSDFGLLAVFIAVATVGATLVTLRYETSILVPKETTESANLVLLSLVLGVGLSATLAIMSALLPTELQEKAGLGSLGHWLPIAFLTAATISTLIIAQTWLNRQKKYVEMAWLRVLQSVTIAGLAIVLGLIQTENGLLFAQIGASTFICFAAIWLSRSAAKFWEKKQLKSTAAIHRSAPVYILPTALLDVVTLQLPVLLIAIWYSESMAGQFSMAWRILMLPMALVGGAIGQVFLQKFASPQKTAEERRLMLKRTWGYLGILGIPAMLIIYTFGESIFKYILGSEWAEAGVIAAILTPMALMQFISSPTSGAYIILGLQKYSLIFGISVLIYRPICIYYGFINNNIYDGLKAWVICEIIQVLLYQLLAWKKIKELK